MTEAIDRTEMQVTPTAAACKLMSSSPRWSSRRRTRRISFAAAEKERIEAAVETARAFMADHDMLSESGADEGFG